MHFYSPPQSMHAHTRHFSPYRAPPVYAHPAVASLQPSNSYPLSQVVYAHNRLQHVNQILEATATEGALFLGDIISTKKPELLLKHNIEAVLSCGLDAVFTPSLDSKIRLDNLKLVAARDTLEYDISVHFDDTFKFIEDQLSNKRNVLVHCHAGVSRSASIVLAYLMRKKSWSFAQSLEHVRLCRKRAKPNESFVQQLLAYEKKLQTADRKTEPLQSSTLNTQNSNTADDKVGSKSHICQESKIEVSLAKNSLGQSLNSLSQQIQGLSFSMNSRTPKKQPRVLASIETTEKCDQSENITDLHSPPPKNKDYSHLQRAKSPMASTPVQQPKFSPESYLTPIKPKNTPSSTSNFVVRSFESPMSLARSMHVRTSSQLVRPKGSVLLSTPINPEVLSPIHLGSSLQPLSPNLYHFQTPSCFVYTSLPPNTQRTAYQYNISHLNDYRC